ETIAWLVGVVQGDGHVNKYFVEISDEHFENIMVVAGAVERLGLKPKVTRDKSERRYRLWICNKKFADLMKTYGAHDKIHPANVEPIYHRSYIRGLYDAEGSCEFWRKRNMIRINFSNKSPYIVNFVSQYLIGYGSDPMSGIRQKRIEFRYTEKMMWKISWRKLDLIFQPRLRN
ncbi:MAG: LAGLIDADG family homing endonuclease, partial [Nitrososphaerota archaeon]|nr:LAGLIDADG family homing endonuclease [Nitrososphaerota archaeon]